MEWKYNKRGEYWEAESEKYFFALGGNKYEDSTEVSLNIFKKEVTQSGARCKKLLGFENFNSIDEGKLAAEKINNGEAA
jgi:hypothetical protein